jgi:hypothetical protein
LSYLLLVGIVQLLHCRREFDAANLIAGPLFC